MQLRATDHVGVVYDTVEQLAATLFPLFAPGGEPHAFRLYLADEQTKSAFLQHLADAWDGCDQPCRPAGLTVRTYADVGLGRDMMDGGRLFPSLAAAIRGDSMQASAEFCCLLLDVPPVGDKPSGLTRAVMEYESQLESFIEEQGCSAVCLYDRRRFPPQVLREALLVHPSILMDGGLFPNPHLVSPDRLLSPDRAEWELNRFLEDLAERDRSESSLRQNEEKLRTVLRTAPVGIGVTRDRVLLEVNDEICNMTGYSRQELLGKDARILYPGEEDYRMVGVEKYAQIQQHGLGTVTTRWQHKAGRVIHVLLSSAPIQPQDLSHGVVFTALDVTEAKQVETALSESEERYRSLFLNNHAVLLLIDPATGQIIDANPAASTYYGYSLDQLRQKNITDINMLSQSQVFAEMERARTERRNYFLFRHRLASGETRDVEVFSGPIQVRGQQLLYSIIHDVTERKHAEDELRRVKEQLDALIQASPLAIVLLDAEGRVQMWNPAATRIFGWSAEQVMNLPAPYVPIHQRDEFAALHRRVMSGESFTGLELKRQRMDGTPLDVSLSTAPIRDDQGRISAILSVIEDVTERKRAEHALLDRERTLANLLNNLPGMAYRCKNDENWTMQFVSQGSTALTGYDPSALIENREQPYADLVHPADRDRVWNQIQHAVQRQQPFVLEYRITDAQGREKVVWEKGSAVYAPDGRVQFLEGVVLDVSDRKDLEGRLRQIEKLEAVGQLAGGVAHDFNNLLSVIMGYADIALNESLLTDATRQNLRQIHEAAERAANLTRQLLAFSRRQVLQLEDLDLNEVVDTLMKMVRRLIGEHIHLNIIAGHDLGAVRADRGQLEQVLLNLAINARDAMPQGGDITIETENVMVDSDYCATHPWAKPGRYVLLSMTDNGCGMDRRTLERIFEPFFTTKGIGQGTGLGLATVYGIVKQHLGMINVYSELNRGTTFKIYLPTVERRAVSVGPKVEGRVRGGTETILLAEDEETLRTLVKRILTRAGYKVLETADGEEALRVFEQHADRIDLALLDVVIPKLSGYALSRKLLARRPDLHVLFTSGYSENAVHTNFVMKSDIRLLTKPYRPTELLKRVRELLDSR